MTHKNDSLLFDSSEGSGKPEAPGTVPNTWKVLIVDDDPEVHQITKLALMGFHFENRGISFLHAYNSREAFAILQTNSDIALAILDVVMETDHAGLSLVQQIRQELGNRSIRIVLRTGQPGLAPERDIITNYDINDYTEKTELSAQKLFTIVVTSLRAYRDILRLKESRQEVLQANEHLTQERERIQVTLDSIGDAVLTTDAKGKITHLNPVAEKLTGWTLTTALKQPLSTIFKIINSQTRLPVANPVERVLSTGAIEGLASHTVLINKDGSEAHIADSAAPIRSITGDILGVILVCRDISREYQTEKALRRSQKMEALGQLTGGIAHDFNNQLGIIIGYLDLLAISLATDDKITQMIETASNAALRCTDLTRQLLSFSHSGSGKKSVVNINSTLKELETMYARSVTPEVEVQYFLSDTLWLTEIDPGEFQDATLNLVINARDAMPKGGKLLIETTNKSLDSGYAALNPDALPGDYVQFMLSDTGKGMDKTTQERIFDPFFTTKPKGKGTGLGMSMVYGFVKRCGGFIKIYSELDVGTTMRLFLPRAAPLLDEDRSDLPNSDPVCPRGQETILVVDDEIDLLELAETMLRDLGYRTYLAENAEQALELLARHDEIDLLFSDVVMPGGMNGYELAQQAIKHNPQLRILLSSGFTSKTITQNGMLHFTQQMLNKPYRKIDLARQIRLVLDEDKES